MTASTLSHLPMAAGGAALAGLGRAGVWAIARYMRAPLANTGMLALATMTALAGTNALYNQHTEHPAPLFAPSPLAPIPAERPDDLGAAPESQVLVAPQVVAPPAVAPLVQPVTGETTGSVPPVVPDQPVGNVEVFEVQKKLLELKLFEGQVDGYYGPMTARAIRAFEERNGLTPQGALTPAVVRAILEADAEGRMPAPPPTPTVAAAPAPQATTPPPAQPIATAAAPAPAPVEVAEQPDILIGPVESRSNPIDAVVASATDTIDSIISELDTRGTPSQPAQRPVPALPLLSSPEPRTANQPMPEPITPAPRPAAPVTQAATPAATATPVATAEPRQAAARPTPQATQPPAQQPSAARGPAQQVTPATGRELVMQVQRGLASLGFLHGAIDGQANEATARAIRNFEVYHNYRVTGQVSPALVDMLVAAGASV
jgi:peptidoglycan hydrolase-like protein with peptidoglycan-binding domain